MKGVYLVLWVYHKRPATALCHQDGVFCRDSVTRQTFCVPLTDDIWVPQNFNQTEAGTDRNVQFLAASYPLVN